MEFSKKALLVSRPMLDHVPVLNSTETSRFQTTRSIAQIASRKRSEFENYYSAFPLDSEFHVQRKLLPETFRRSFTPN